MVQDVGRAFSFGGVFGRSFSTLFRNFLQFFVIALVIQVPFTILILLLGLATGVGMGMEGGMGADGPGPADPLSMGAGAAVVFALIYILSLLSYLLINAATVFGAVEHLRGAPVRIGACLTQAFNRLAPIIMVSLLVLAIAIGVGLLGFLLNLLLAAIAPAATIIGSILVVAAFVYLFLRWWVVIPVAVVEAPGALSALSRAAYLTEGHRWLILAIWVVLAIVVFVGLLVLGVAVGWIPLVGQLIVWAASIAAMALFSIATAVGYHDLRVEKEGVTADDIAQVFD